MEYTSVCLKDSMFSRFILDSKTSGAIYLAVPTYRRRDWGELTSWNCNSCFGFRCDLTSAFTETVPFDMYPKFRLYLAQAIFSAARGIWHCPDYQLTCTSLGEEEKNRPFRFLKQIILTLTNFFTLWLFTDKLWPLGLKQLLLTKCLSDEQETHCIIVHSVLQC